MRRTRIIIETDEIVVARRIAGPVLAWCEKCERQTGMVTLTQAALVAQVAQDTIQEWMQGGQLHVLECRERGLLICLPSLDKTR